METGESTSGPLMTMNRAAAGRQSRTDGSNQIQPSRTRVDPPVRRSRSTLMRRSKSSLIILGGAVIAVFVCGFTLWGVREILFPRTDVCALEAAERDNPSDSNRISPPGENIDLIGHIGGRVTKVIIRDDLAYVTIFPRGLAIFDAKDPSHLERIGYVYAPGDLIHVDVERKYALILGSPCCGLWRVDVSDPDNLSAVHLSSPMDHLESVRLADEKVILTTSRCELLIGFSDQGIAIPSRCDDTVRIIDSGDPDAPVVCLSSIPARLAGIEAAFTGQELLPLAPQPAEQGGYSYTVDRYGVLEVKNILNGDVTRYPMPYQLTDVFSYGTDLYTTTAPFESQLENKKFYISQFDLSDPTNPKYVDKLPYKPEVAAEWRNYVFLRERWSRDGYPPGLEILDMSVPASGEMVTAPEFMSEIVYMTFVNDRAYATTSKNELLVIDFSNAEMPVLLARQSLGPSDQLNNGISVVNGYAYILVYDQYIRVMDVSDETTITQVGSYPMASRPFEMAVKDEFAFINAGNKNLEILDISSPAQPRLVASFAYDVPDMLYDIQLLGNYLFIATGISGLQVLDITDPVHPARVGYFQSGFITVIEVDCPYIYVTVPDNGLYVLRFDPMLPTCAAEAPTSSGP